MRKFCVLLHRYVGLFLAGFLFVAGVTGAIISFDHEIDRWLNPGVLTVEAGGTPLAPGDLIARIERERPEAVVWYMVLPQHPADAVRVLLQPRNADAALQTAFQNPELLVHPATGGVLGIRDRGAFHPDRLHLIPWLYQFHYSLNLERWGMWVFGAVGIAWFLDSFVGLYLAWPQRTRAAVKQALTVKFRGSSPTRVNFDLHRASGIWTFAVLIIVALTGVAMNLYEELYHPVLTVFSPPTPRPRDVLPKRPDPTAPLTVSPSAAIAAADRALVDRGLSWRLGEVLIDHETGVYDLRYHTAADVTADRAGAEVYVSAEDGRVIQFQQPNQGTAGDMIDDWVLPLHGGRAFGLAGKIVICAIGLVVAMLSVTGVVIWWQKRRGRLAATRRRTSASLILRRRDGSGVLNG